MEILTAAQIKAVEETVISETGIPAIVLMERAGLAVFGECAERITPDAKILILAGRGNNGGDGLVTARLFHNAGFDVTVMMPAGKTALSKQTGQQKNILRNSGVKIQEISQKRVLPSMDGYDLIIDALLGTGLNRPADEFLSGIINAANRASAWKVAVDIPSGLDASSCNIIGETFLADLTVTFCRPKVPHHLHPAKAFCGEVVTADIGIADASVEKVKAALHFLTERNTPPMPEREIYGHKGNYGHAVIIGGSAGKYGAAVMSSLAALRGGAGLVTCALPNLSPLSAWPELMGFHSGDKPSFTPADADAVTEFCRSKSAAAIGPGLSRTPECLEFAQKIIKSTEIPLVIDADALFALDAETLKILGNRAVLTPHIGEFAHMLGVNKSTVEQDKLALAGECARKNKIYLILKSSETIISTPDGQQYVSVWGTPALSKGGSGDILTGILTALLAQGYHMADACKLACRIQGEAARTAQKTRNAFAVSPTDILNSIGTLF